MTSVRVVRERPDAFPDEWAKALRAIDPVSETHSWLEPVWYHAGQRWVLYDMKPSALIRDDELQGAPITGAELRAALEGPPPRLLSRWEACPFVSDVQHELWRRHRAYGRPYWVLQGTTGGHQVAYDPWQKNLLAAQRLPTEPPPIGRAAWRRATEQWEADGCEGPAPVYLEPCPFDNRVVRRLLAANQFRRLGESLARLEREGRQEAADRRLAEIQAEIRKAQAAFVEDVMTPLTDMALSLRQRSEHADQLIRVPAGTASRMHDAYQQWLATGDYAA